MSTSLLRHDSHPAASCHEAQSHNSANASPPPKTRQLHPAAIFRAKVDARQSRAHSAQSAPDSCQDSSRPAYRHTRSVVGVRQVESVKGSAF